jgi:hypothetical protein
MLPELELIGLSWQATEGRLGRTFALNHGAYFLAFAGFGAK